MQAELAKYFRTGVEPEVTPYDGEAERGLKLLRCASCDTLVWKDDKKALHDMHIGHRLVVATNGSVQEALMLKYDLIRSEEGE